MRGSRKFVDGGENPDVVIQGSIAANLPENRFLRSRLRNGSPSRDQRCAKKRAKTASIMDLQRQCEAASAIAATDCTYAGRADGCIRSAGVIVIQHVARLAAEIDPTPFAKAKLLLKHRRHAQGAGRIQSRFGAGIVAERVGRRRDERGWIEPLIDATLAPGE